MVHKNELWFQYCSASTVTKVPYMLAIFFLKLSKHFWFQAQFLWQLSSIKGIKVRQLGSSKPGELTKRCLVGMCFKLWWNLLRISTSVLYVHRLFWTKWLFLMIYFYGLEGLGLQNTQILEESLQTHMFKWCFHGYNWLEFANLPSTIGKTYLIFPKFWVSGYRHHLSME